ncbi:MAG: hypothetical protein F6K31_44475, partial [Symploca sp. SIO2G7]|nr:hypothetical protein [Symploca sp. SIO2G7]
MPSSSRPYTSKLLRFVLGQWQRGLERQDRAWRQLQSTAAWGAQVAIFPVYAILRAAERASVALGDSNLQPETAAETTTVAKAATSGLVTDLEHSLTAISTHTQQILSLKQKGQLTVVPKRSFIRKTKVLLYSTVRQVRQQLAMTLQVTNQSATIAQSRGRGENLTPGYTASINRKTTFNLAQNGTTLASSLKTQKLVLVNANNEVFDIFTSAQQSDLTHYISQVMQAYEQLKNHSKT